MVELSSRKVLTTASIHELEIKLLTYLICCLMFLLIQRIRFDLFFESLTSHSSIRRGVCSFAQNCLKKLHTNPSEINFLCKTDSLYK